MRMLIPVDLIPHESAPVNAAPARPWPAGTNAKATILHKLGRAAAQLQKAGWLSEAGIGVPLASGVLAASAVMCVPAIIATAVLNVAVSIRPLSFPVGPLLVAALVAWFGVRKQKQPTSREIAASNPVQFKLALQMAVLFQFAV